MTPAILAMALPPTMHWALTAVYAATALWAAVRFFKSDPKAQSRIRQALALLAALHLTTIIAHGVMLSRLPLFAPSELISAVAFGSITVFLVLDFRFRDLSGAFIPLLFALAFQMTAAITAEDPAVDKAIFKATIVEVHTILIVIIYSFFTISAIHCLLYLLLYRALKNNRFEGVIFRRLPNLTRLERLGHHAMVAGLLLFVLFLMEAFTYYFFYHIEGSSSWDAKFTIALVILGAYLACFVWRDVLGKPWRHSAFLNFLAYVLILVSLFVIRHEIVADSL